VSLPEAKPKRIRLSTILKLVISIIILFFLFRYANLPLIVANLKRLNVWLFLVNFLILPFSILIRSYRWTLILNNDERKITLYDSFILSWIGLALNLVLPASTGEVARAYYGYKKLGIKEEMLSSSLTDKLVGLIAIFVVGGISSAVFGLYQVALLSLIVVTIFSIFVYVPRAVPWGILNKLLDRFFKFQFDYHKLIDGATMSFNVKVSTMTLSLIAWVITFFQFFLVGRMFAVDVSFLYVLAVAPIIAIAKVFPLTLSGLGSQEAIVVYLFGLTGIKASSALLVSLFFSFYYVVIPGLIGYLLILSFKERA